MSKIIDGNNLPNIPWQDKPIGLSCHGMFGKLFPSIILLILAPRLFYYFGQPLCLGVVTTILVAISDYFTIITFVKNNLLKIT